MIISNNKTSFGSDSSMDPLKLVTKPYGITEFFAFKPATVVKTAGYLSIATSGGVNLPQSGISLQLCIQIVHGNFSFEVPIIYDQLMPEGYSLYTSHVELPVGSGNPPDGDYSIVTTHINNTSVLYGTASYLPVDTDTLYLGTFVYRTFYNDLPITLPTLGLGVRKVIVEYKEQ